MSVVTSVSVVTSDNRAAAALGLLRRERARRNDVDVRLQDGGSLDESGGTGKDLGFLTIVLSISSTNKKHFC